jgi:hypothetical protein
MKIGFASIYPSRPHIKHMVYLINQAIKAGHEIYFLECNGAFENCSKKICRNIIEKKISCLACNLGGLKGYIDKKPDLFSNLINDNHSNKNFSYSAISTIAGINGISEQEELNNTTIRNQIALSNKTINKAYIGAINWIKSRNFDLIFGFNGRLDITNAILNAALDCQIPYVSLERSWLGKGIQLNFNGTPLSLSGFDDVVSTFNDKPLNKMQISKAFLSISNRFNKISYGEFKQYNIEQTRGLTNTTFKWLYLPSSIFERIGHPDWKDNWEDSFHPIKHLIKIGVIKKSELIIRGHPQWTKYSPSSEKEFIKKSKEIGVKYIPSNSNISTHELIVNCENLIVYGSSSAFEAGLLGKRILNFSPTFYQNGLFIYNYFSEVEFDYKKFIKMDPKFIIIQTLRTIYSINFRYMQFTDFIIAQTSYNYKFKEFEDLNYFDKIIENYKIPYNDYDFSSSSKEENDFLDNFFNKRCDKIFDLNFCLKFENKTINNDFSKKIKRKINWRFMDFIDLIYRN